MENGGKIQIQDGASEIILQCCFCYKKKFNKGIKLRMHILRIHKSPKDLKCEYCEKSFSYNTYLRTHIKTIHEGIKPEKINNCHF